MIKFKNSFGSDCSTLPLSSITWPRGVAFILVSGGRARTCWTLPFRAVLPEFWEMEPGQELHETTPFLVQEDHPFEYKLRLC